MYAVYILLCHDNSYYTGQTNDLDKRFWQHETGFFPECYTFKRRPVKLAWHTLVATSEEANDLEKQIKGWSKKKKEALITGDIMELKRLSNYKKSSLNALRQAQGQTGYIIVGQGITGTFLSWYLHKAQKSFVVIDNHDNNAPSRLAAGIINPVTGRRMVTVWMAEEILPFAKQAYDEIGKELSITAISQKNIIDFFPNPFMRENFLKRLTDGNDYIGPVSNEQQFSSFFNYEFGCGEIKPAYTAHLETLLPAWRKQLKDSGAMMEEDFDITQLQVSGGKIQYRNLEADKIIFCDGAAGTNNPYFKQLPFAPNKGEALVVEIPGLPDSNLFKKSMMLAPLPGAGRDIFWIGSNYLWDFKDADPTPEFRKNTEAILKEWLKLPYTILEHRAGIRPATLERRPFAGFHPQQPHIGILNGMGTKGCSLAPYFAKQVADHLTTGLPIHTEADVKRFTKVLSR